MTNVAHYNCCSTRIIAEALFSKMEGKESRSKEEKQVEVGSGTRVPMGLGLVWSHSDGCSGRFPLPASFHLPGKTESTALAAPVGEARTKLWSCILIGLL